ncbi:MAG: beta-N-acetylhexosaminidase, partial [Gammaproteobacteria bacterium]
MCHRVYLQFKNKAMVSHLMTNTIGAFIVDVEGKDLTAEERELLGHPLVGGVVLFARNYESRDQLQHLCHQIRAAHKSPLLIMVDQEGGRVQRFKEEFTRLPPMATFGKAYDEEPEKACQSAKECGALMAAELLSVGVDLSLAPILDLDKKRNTVIGDRAFHANAQTVITLAKAFIRGMQETGMASVGKHFPGHGGVALDSHVAIPVDGRSLSELQCDDLMPFAHLIQAGIPALMAAHIVFPEVDELPVGFSSRWLKDVLRTQLKFTGTILSDDLNMEGANISSHYADR